MTVFASIYSVEEEPSATLKRVPSCRVQFSQFEDRERVVLHRIFENAGTLDQRGVSAVVESYVNVWRRHAPVPENYLANFRSVKPVGNFTASARYPSSLISQIHGAPSGSLDTAKHSIGSTNDACFLGSEAKRACICRCIAFFRKTKAGQISNARTRLDPGIRWLPDDRSQNHSYRYGRVLCVRGAARQSATARPTCRCGVARESVRGVCCFV